MDTLKKYVGCIALMLLPVLAAPAQDGRGAPRQNPLQGRDPGWNQRPGSIERGQGNSDVRRWNRGDWGTGRGWQDDRWDGNAGRWNDEHGWDDGRGEWKIDEPGIFWGGGIFDYYNPYATGYGYNVAPYGLTGNFENSFEAGYADGYSSGRFDKSQGYLYNPRQYERSQDTSYFEGFVAGYQDGWRQ